MEKKTAVLILLMTITLALVVNLLKPTRVMSSSVKAKKIDVNTEIAQVDDEEKTADSKACKADLLKNHDLKFAVEITKFGDDVLIVDKNKEQLLIDYNGFNGAVLAIMDQYGNDFYETLLNLNQFIELKPIVIGPVPAETKRKFIIYGKTSTALANRYWGITKKGELYLGRESTVTYALKSLEESKNLVARVPSLFMKDLDAILSADGTPEAKNELFQSFLKSIQKIPVALTNFEKQGWVNVSAYKTIDTAPLKYKIKVTTPDKVNQKEAGSFDVKKIKHGFLVPYKSIIKSPYEAQFK